MKIKEIIREITGNKEKLIQFSIFLVLVVLVFVGMTFFKDSLQSVGSVVLVIELAILVTVAWALAGHAVVKSLFFVGASLSLMIFLAQSYCDVPNLTQSSNDALKSLLAFSFIYLGFDFFRSLYKEVVAHMKKLKEINDGKNSYMMLIPFALFVGIFLWQLAQVLLPIVQDLCIYK